ncbi:hypothetical protein [Flavobacterium sp. W21_SRS_FM6]|uniref:hypothetical protein n=1 Tax=Flavobacterium sp. W21_SRS_FM6 TaxID=3240268 RepID=UPI003F90646D
MLRLFFLFICFWHLPLKAEKYTVASQDFNYYPHYNFQSKTDKGLIWAVLQAFSEYSGHEFSYDTMPVLRLQRELEKGTVDLVYPDNPLFDNADAFALGKYYSDTIVQTLGGTMVEATRVNQDITKIRRLSIPLGFTPQLGWLQQIEKGKVKLISVVTPLAELHLLALGRVDAAEVDYFVSQYQIQNNPDFKQFRFDPTLPNSAVDFKLSTIKQIGLIDEINDFMHSHPEIIRKIKLQYGISEPELIIQNLMSSVPRSH